ATPNHDEALARLHFLVEGRRRLGLVAGMFGIGKSLLLEVFAQQISHAGGEVARASLLGIDNHELLWTLAAQFGLAPTTADSPFVLWRSLTDFLVRSRYENRQVLVVCDDADAAQPDTLDLAHRLVQFESGRNPRKTVLLATTDSGLARLPLGLLEMAELAINLEPWEPADTAGFLEASLHKAGCRQAVFTTAAVERLHHLSGGFPLRLKQLADLALLAGAGLKLRQIEAHTVSEACQELGVVVPAH
ncbi:MAG TPA: AAA family ATPase, partial [Pirellulales bacterium]|nr:AAA family ATPase [Pirellulales bacterium]